MKRLLIFDYFRGVDSTGMAAVRKHGGVVTSKIDSNPISLFDMKSFDTALSAYSSKAFIGHNRATTSGATSPANAHPFTYGNITGAQNGTLDKESHRDLEYMLLDEYDVDSQALFASIDQNGIESTIEQISGAWALTWYDKEDGTLNFLRNDQRPLWYAWSDDMTKLIWASEWAIIQAAVSIGTNTIKLKSDDQGYTYFPFATDTLYSFDLDRLANGEYTDIKESGKIATIKGKEPKKVVTMGTGSPFVRNETSKSLTTTKHTTNTSQGGHGTSGTHSGDIQKNQTSVITVVSNDDKPFGDALTREEFYRLSKGECSFCGDPVSYDGEGMKVYADESIVLCQSCAHTGTKANTLILDDISAFA